MFPASAVVAAVAAVTLVGAPAVLTGGSGAGRGVVAGSVAAPVVAGPVAVRADDVPPDAAVRDSWEWPLAPRPAVLRRFDVGPARWSAGHRGVDLAARPGGTVRAPAAGVVHFVGAVAGRPVLSISHDGGLISSFEPVSSTLRPGDPVAAGESVGSLFSLPGHCFPASCLHWGVRRGEVYVDPLSLVRGVLRPIVLKPLAGLGPTP